MQTGFLLSFILLGFLSIVSLVISLYIKKRFSQKPNTPKAQINEILHKMMIDKNDSFIDLGAGDFRMVFAARQKTDADSTGVEISPLLVFVAKLIKIRDFGIDRNPEIKIENLQKTNLSKYSVIYANVDDSLLPGLLANIKDSGTPSAMLFTLNSDLPGIKPEKSYRIDENSTLYKYSVNKIKELN